MNWNQPIIGAVFLSACTAATAASTLSVGSTNSMAVRKDGAVLVWGGNVYGQLGNGYTNRAYVPILSSVHQGAVAVASGEGHSMALRKDGSVWTWGLNDSGQLGQADLITRHQARPVVYMSEIKAIAAGGNHALALRAAVRSWKWYHRSRLKKSNQRNTLLL